MGVDIDAAADGAEAIEDISEPEASPDSDICGIIKNAAERAALSIRISNKGGNSPKGQRRYYAEYDMERKKKELPGTALDLYGLRLFRGQTVHKDGHPLYQGG